MQFNHAGYIRMAAQLSDADLIGAWETATEIMGHCFVCGELEAYDGVKDWRRALEREWNSRPEFRPLFQPRA